jgi:hypothetical protein
MDGIPYFSLDVYGNRHLDSCTIRLPNSFEPDRSFNFIETKTYNFKFFKYCQGTTILYLRFTGAIAFSVLHMLLHPFIFMNVFKVDAKLRVDFCISMSLSFIGSIN